MWKFLWSNILVKCKIYNGHRAKIVLASGFMAILNETVELEKLSFVSKSLT